MKVVTFVLMVMLLSCLAGQVTRAEYKETDLSQATASSLPYDLKLASDGNNVVTVASAGRPADLAFDGSIYSSYNAETSPVNILFAFGKAKEFTKIRVQTKQDCSWWVEIADTYTDFESKSGSYQVIEKEECKADEWGQYQFPSPVIKKYWKVWFENEQKNISIAEIELYTTTPPDSLAGLQSELELWEGWRWRNAPYFLFYLDNLMITKGSAEWKSSNTDVASVDAEGNIRALKAGQALITASYMGATCTTKVTVKAPVLPPVKEKVEEYMATPVKNCIYELPVLIIQYIPTDDGQTKDPAYAPEFYDLQRITLDSSKKRTMTALRRYKFALEMGSRYHGYKDPSARSSIGVKVVDVITVYEPLPPGLRNYDYNDGILQYAVDFEQIFDRFNIKDYVENKGVRQIWMQLGSTTAYMWNYNPDAHKPEAFRASFESFMATPTQNQACNGGNPEPLPIYNKTYTVIDQFMTFPTFTCYDFEPFTHQFEKLWQRQNAMQDGDSSFFWQRFVGKTGRCGWTHTPPNTEINYGYFHYIQDDTTQVKPTMCDIEDWNPDNTGEKKLISYHSWEDIVYNWPDGIQDFDGRREFQWFMYWLQAIPGYDNNIIFDYKGNSCRMRNWWQFVADWDTYTEKDTGLWEVLTGVNDANSEQGFNVELYPDPNEGLFNVYVNSPGSGNCNMVITNMMGYEVYKASNLARGQVQAVDLTGAAAGVYFVRITGGGKTVVRKFVKER